MFLSSNNWQAGGNYEFVYMIDNEMIARTIYDEMRTALAALKPVEPVL